MKKEFFKTRLIIGTLILFSSTVFLFSQTTEEIKKENEKKLAIFTTEVNNFVEANYQKDINAEKVRIVAQYGGTSHSILEDLTQAIAQTVIDKATNEAFNLIKKRVCEYLTKSNFINTTEVMNALRFQEIITSRNVLYKAFVNDLINYIFNNDFFTSKELDNQYLGLVVKNILLQKLIDLNSPIDISITNAIFGTLTDHFINKKEYSDEKECYVFFAVYSVWKARKDLEYYVFQKFSIKEELDKTIEIFNKDSKFKTDNETYYKALNIAISLQHALSVSKPTELRDGLKMLVDAIFEAIVLIKGDTNLYLNCGREIVNAALNRDVNQMISSIIKLLVNSNEDQIKGIKYIGAVLLYAQTYTDKKYLDNQDAAQKERTRIISSLVLDRKSGEKNGFFSFGGSLGYIFGKSSISDDTNTDSNVQSGPLSVPIGFAYQCFAKGSDFGLHFGFNIVDLGQYTSFDNGKGEVKKPLITDILSPSVTAAICVIKSFPLYLGATYGYSPKYFEDKEGVLKKGKFKFSISLGIYIPLFDF